LDRTIARQRVQQQGLAAARFTGAAEVVAWFGAMQAQDYPGMLWALGMRVRGADEAAIERAIADGDVVRTHLFRGTWQCIARDDVRWMLALGAGPVRKLMARRLAVLELDDRTVGRGGELVARALEGGQQRTRDELAEALRRGGIDVEGQRLAHLVGCAELAGIACSGGRRGKQTTYALLDERVPPQPARTREEMLAELARRFFQSRGPATVDDLVWWSGLPITAAREAVALAGVELVERDGRSYGRLEPRAARASAAQLLPAFDEYLIGYRVRDAQLDPAHTSRVNAGGGMFHATFTVDGAMLGTWRRKTTAREAVIELRPFGALPRAARPALIAAAERHAAFLGRRAKLA
jgi:hypothetical protein